MSLGQYISVITPNIPLWAVFYDPEEDQLYTKPVVAFGVVKENLESCIADNVQIREVYQDRRTTEWLTFYPYVNGWDGISPAFTFAHFLGLSETKIPDQLKFKEDIQYCREQERERKKKTMVKEKK